MNYQFQMRIWQATALWHIFANQHLEQQDFIRNVAGDIKDIPKELQDRVIRKPLPAG
jgi:hypothetical protein